MMILQDIEDPEIAIGRGGFESRLLQLYINSQINATINCTLVLIRNGTCMQQLLLFLYFHYCIMISISICLNLYLSFKTISEYTI